MVQKYFKKIHKGNESGFTLIEVLAAIIILSIVSLVLTSYFTNAMSYSKANQNKTVMINLARNALFYMEKQDFDQIKLYFMGQEAQGSKPEIVGHSGIRASGCDPRAQTSVSCDVYKTAVSNVGTLAQVLNPTINNIDYHIDIEYQSALHKEMMESTDPIEQATAEYLLPVNIRVRDSLNDGEKGRETVVEGYITDEKIR